MWEVLSSTSFDDLMEAKMLKVVGGENVAVGGLKRMVS